MGGGMGGMPPMVQLGGGAAPAAGGASRIYVTQLSDELDGDTLKAYFSYFGTVKDVYIPTDKVTGQKKPFAFVTMTSPEETDSVLSMPTHQVTEIHSVNT